MHSVRYIVGVDIDGIFNDCAVVGRNDENVSIKIGKASSAPPDFQTVFIDDLYQVSLIKTHEPICANRWT